MNWWNESIESKTLLYVKENLTYEKFVDFSYEQKLYLRASVLIAPDGIETQ